MEQIFIKTKAPEAVLYYKLVTSLSIVPNKTISSDYIHSIA